MALNVNYNNYNNRLNLNTNISPENAARMALAHDLGNRAIEMKTYRGLYNALCSYENLELAFKKARKGKTLKNYVLEFEAELDNNLKQLKYELETLTYSPAPGGI